MAMGYAAAVDGIHGNKVVDPAVQKINTNTGGVVDLNVGIKPVRMNPVADDIKVSSGGCGPNNMHGTFICLVSINRDAFYSVWHGARRITKDPKAADRKTGTCGCVTIGDSHIPAHGGF